MTRFHLRLGNADLSFGSAALLLVLASVCAAMLLSSFVDTLQDSVRRGQALRQTQRTDVASVLPSSIDSLSPLTRVSSTREGGSKSR